MTDVPRQPRTTFNQRVVAWFFLAIFILAMIAYAMYRNMTGLIDESTRVGHTYEVLRVLDDTMLQLRDMHASQRGYFITAQENMLSPYYRAAPLVEENVNHLLKLVADNPLQEKRATALHELVFARLKSTDASIKLFNEQGQQAAFAYVASGAGQREINVIRSDIAIMQAEEQRLLKERQALAEDSAWQALISGGFGLVGTLGILATVFWIIRRETQRRNDSERSLTVTVNRLKQLTVEARQLAQLGDFLQSCRSPQEAYTLLEQNLPRLFPETSGALGIFNHSRNVIELIVRWGDERECFQSHFLPEDCWALRRGKVHVSQDRQSGPLCGHVTDAIQHYYCLPMQAHGETIGVLSITTDSPMEDDDSRTLLVRAVSEQISLALANLQLQETLRLQTVSDPLTHLFNRRYMEASLEREFLRARRTDQPISVVMIDVDHFKRFNDTYGHEAGDKILIAFAKLMRQHVRGDDIPCRYGGEEFMIILPGAPLEIAVQRAETLREATLSLAVDHLGHTLGQISLSAGVASFPHHSTQAERLLADADAALYAAKQNGRNRVETASTQSATTKSNPIL